MGIRQMTEWWVDTLTSCPQKPKSTSHESLNCIHSRVNLSCLIDGCLGKGRPNLPFMPHNNYLDGWALTRTPFCPFQPVVRGPGDHEGSDSPSRCALCSACWRAGEWCHQPWEHQWECLPKRTPLSQTAGFWIGFFKIAFKKKNFFLRLHLFKCHA